MSDKQYHLSISGSAPNGESFDVGLYFNNETELDYRLDRLVVASRAAMAAIIDPAEPSVRIEIPSNHPWGLTEQMLAEAADRAVARNAATMQKTGV